MTVTNCSKPPGRSWQLLGSLKLLFKPCWTMSSYVWANKEERAFVKQKVRYTSLTTGASVRPLDIRKLLSFPETGIPSTHLSSHLRLTQCESSLLQLLKIK